MENTISTGDSAKTLAEVMEEVTVSLSNEVREIISDDKGKETADGKLSHPIPHR